MLGRAAPHSRPLAPYAREAGANARRSVGFCYVAHAGLVAALPLLLSAGPKRKP